MADRPRNCGLRISRLRRIESRISEAVSRLCEARHSIRKQIVGPRRLDPTYKTALWTGTGMRESLLFLGQTFRQIRVIGTAVPSGPVVARTMAKAVGDLGPGKVILELGPGTGSFTRQLVRQYPRHRVVAIEFVEAFAKHLSKAMPTVTVVNGCASELNTHLTKLGVGPGDVGAVVSGLPFLTLPADLTPKIMNSIRTTLPVGGRFVQITFSERGWSQFPMPGFVREQSRRVWWNVPPAVVMTFTKTK